MQQPFFTHSSPLIWAHCRVGGARLFPFLEIAVSVRPSCFCTSFLSKSLRLSRLQTGACSCRNSASLQGRSWKRLRFSLMVPPLRVCNEDEALWPHLHSLCQLLCCSGIWATKSHKRRWAKWKLQWLFTLLSVLCEVSFSSLTCSCRSEH